jgi:hypothetical protein
MKGLTKQCFPGKCDEVMQQVMSHMNLEIPDYIRSKDPIFSHATFLHPAEMHTTTQPLLKQPLQVMQESCPNCGNSEVEAVCCCTRSRSVKLEDGEVSGSNHKDEIRVCEKEDSTSQEFHMLKRNSGNFNFVNTGTAEVGALDKNIEDPSEVLEEQSLKEELEKSDAMTVLVGDNWFQNQSENISLDVGFDKKFRSNLPCNESVTSMIGLKMNLDTSFDQVLNSDQGNCDQNSLRVKNITVECSTSMNHRKCSHLIGINSQSSSSINSTGCDRGKSSITDTGYVPSGHANEASPLHSISTLSLQSLTNILQIEHNYSKKPSSHRMNKESQCTEERNSKVKGIKGSMHSLENRRRSIQCKRLKIDRTEMQGATSFSHLPQSASPQSTKRSTGTQKTKDEKQICDDKYDFGDTTMCSFCKSNYSSNSCLFYPQWTSKFENIPLGSQVSICECCDTDEDGDTDDVDHVTCNLEGGDNHDSNEGKGNTDANKVSKVPNINPGWYGKGYRKRTKKKRLEKL